MGETFYTALGVPEDADDETIRSAYRDLVKQHHPDVSDDPAASERFKRLTTARDVLVDEDERSRYDRLGHERYVSRHVESGLWTSDTAKNERQRGQRRAQRSPTPEHSRAAWLGNDGPGQERTSKQRRGSRRARSQRVDGQRWQYASGVYERRDTTVKSENSSFESVAAGLRSVGPWLAIHVVFILSALATGWFTYTQAERTLGLSVPSMTFGILIVGLVVFLSFVHVLSQLYA